jgi:chromate transporter
MRSGPILLAARYHQVSFGRESFWLRGGRMKEGSQSSARITADVADVTAGASDQQATEEGPRPISMIDLARVFLAIGATSFGGLGPALAVIERELVAKRSILLAADVAEAVAATRLLPGSSLIQVASFLGYRIRGWRGSAVATVACILPPAIAMLALAVFTESLPSHPALGSAARGLTAAVVGLLLASMCRLGRATIGGPAALGLGLGAFGSASVLRVPAAAAVVVAGLIGILLLSAPEAERANRPRRGGRS